jgi:carboxyl-terminal processing protease
MLRPGVDEPNEFTIAREVIRLKAVPYAAMLEGDIGYVPLLTFLETSEEEMRAAVDSLQQEGMRGLIVDVRGNPGGLLDQGIAVTDLFLEPGSSIVETRGRAADQNDTYSASRPDRWPGLPVVMLVDATSASASEIFAGALQDHDRAVLVGETTYGKGSVQSLYRLTGGDVLRLTTAKWYTPLGRSIDAEHSGEPDLESHTLSISGQIVLPVTIEGRPEYESAAGRTIYGGGGITPDLFVYPETLAPREVTGVQGLFRRAGRFSVAVFDYAVDYVAKHPGLAAGFTLTDAELADFETSLVDSGVDVDSVDFADAERFVRYHLEREIATQAWGEIGPFLQLQRHDRQLQRALEILSGAGSPAELLQAVGSAEPDPSPDR